MVTSARAITIAKSVGLGAASPARSVETLAGTVVRHLPLFRRWKPFLPSATAGRFTMADLVKFATTDPATF